MIHFAIHPEMNPIIRYQMMFNIAEDQFERLWGPGNRWFGGPGEVFVNMSSMSLLNDAATQP